MPMARVLVWIGGLLIATVLILAVLPFPILRLEVKDSIGSAIQIAAFLIAALMVLFTVVSEERATRASVEREERLTRATVEREIYQRLEVESIALFRFNILNRSLAAHIWEQANLPKEMGGICLEDYLSQILNLFEMAVRFRRLDIAPHDAFASWVVWIDNLCSSQHFCAYWREHNTRLRWSYVPELRDLIDKGLDIHHGNQEGPPMGTEQARTKRFFETVADHFNCNVIRHWYSEGKTCQT